MEKTSTDQYGRKTWNVEAYEKEAKSKSKQDDATISSNLTLSNKPSSYIQHRSKLLEESISAVKKHNLINPLNTKAYGKNKRFGFSCPVCELSFRDNLALIDHVNSPSHVERTRLLTKKADSSADDQELLDGGVRRASLSEVVATIESLVAALIKKKQLLSTGESIQERIEKRSQFEKQKQEKRRQKRQAKKRKLNVVVPPEDSEMASLMGFSGFASSKK